MLDLIISLEYAVFSCSFESLRLPFESLYTSLGFGLASGSKFMVISTFPIGASLLSNYSESTVLQFFSSVLIFQNDHFDNCFQ